ncbi:MAG: ABC transporter permease [Planctomycetaceae bacterium]|nr:ABC transporter permease [Planctomycetaceae bacterium]
MGLAFLQILLLDVAFLALCVLAMAPLVTCKKAAFAVLKRNFVGYFSNPTGYVFLCLFVLLTSFAAFWPHEFFTANLANLDQLNNVLPLIMLVFIPAITMSIWAEERRQGTDELLLTLPADDFDIVIGKYLAAAAIFTVSLMFSQFSNYMVLASLSLGEVDTGLFFTTYLGYWLVGLAMLAVGMVASFLTSNMTVGFILGAALNAPLAFAGNADVIVRSSEWARKISFWSLSQNFEDLGRGVFSLSSLVYFALVIAVGLYLSMVLIGARHWSGRGGPWQFAHYVARAGALVLILAFATMFFTDHDWFRIDATAGQVSSLSPKTKELIHNLDSGGHPVIIDAFVSDEIPEDYIQTKFNLVSLLREFAAMSRGRIKVNLHENLELFSEDAAVAEKRFGIRPTTVQTQERGAWTEKEVIMGAAFNCGLDKVVVPFFDYGIPAEYELIRSIGTVAQTERKRLGVVRTDANLSGGFSFAGGMPQQIPKSPFLEELEKQYDVETVDPTSPIDGEKYDAILVVQPSSLGPQELPNVVEAVKSGVPAAIFEDPRPSLGEMSRVPGTGDPKQAPGGMLGGGQGPQPKGNIRELWTALGIDVTGEPAAMGYQPDLAWQTYNPYPKLSSLNDAWVFAGNEAPGGEGSLNPDDPITSGLTEILLPMVGTIQPSSNSELKFTALIQTGGAAGTVRNAKFQEAMQMRRDLSQVQGRSSGRQILAARIEGVSKTGGDGEEEKKDEDELAATEPDTEEASKPVHAVYVADIDLMMSQFVRLRAQPTNEIQFRFENVTFLLNAIDVLTGDDEYVEIRQRKPFHSTLRIVEDRVSEQRKQEEEQIDDYQSKFEAEQKKLDDEGADQLKKITDKQDSLKTRQRAGEDVQAEIDATNQQLAIKQREIDIKKAVQREVIEKDLNEKVKEARRQTEVKILDIQNRYKLLAAAIPPIPPLLVALIVFVSRRLREREGIVKSRLRV